MKLLALACLLGLSAAMSDDVLELLKHRSIPKEAEKLSGQELVDYLNTKQSFFKAKLNSRFAGLTHLQKAKRIGGVRGSIKHRGQQLKKHLVDNSAFTVDIPDSFDSRTQWANCPSIGYIRDQSACGGCWAFGATEAMSDRICIASGGKINVELSAADLMGCCHGPFSCGSGCDGGVPIAAWRWWVSDGIVTGSNYADQAGCYPYTMPECDHHSPNVTHYKPCPEEYYPTPTCVKSCPNSGYKTPYTQDKYYGKSAYEVSEKVADIQKEIMLNGPLEASINVYEDFEHYSGGIYVHHAGQYTGGHAVRVLGWGVDDGTPYWLAANSWNTDWGEKGYFRIIRGTDECAFEEDMVGGLPKL